MLKVRKILAVICALAMLVSIAAVPASAATESEVLYAEIYGGATISSRQAKKERSGNFLFTAQPSGSSGWSSKGDEWVYFRGRGSTSTIQKTQNIRTNYRGTVPQYDLPYIAGYGGLGSSYRIAIEYDNNNPYQWVNLYLTWTP